MRECFSKELVTSGRIDLAEKATTVWMVGLMRKITWQWGGEIGIRRKNTMIS